MSTYRLYRRHWL